MKKKSIITISIIAGVLLVVIIGLLFSGIRLKDGKVYSRVNSYQHIEPGMGACMAIMPQCGVCMGKNGEMGIVENKICYAPL